MNGQFQGEQTQISPKPKNPNLLVLILINIVIAIVISVIVVYFMQTDLRSQVDDIQEEVETKLKYIKVNK